MEKTLEQKIADNKAEAARLSDELKAEKQAARNAAHVAEMAKRNAFRADLEKEHGVPSDHFLANNLWFKAWEDGHSYGYTEFRYYTEVSSHYAELVELFFDPLNK